MKTLGPALLLLEAIVVGLAIPVAVVLYDGGPRAAWTLGILAVLLLLGAGYARQPRGVAVGSALQLLVVLSGVVVPALALLGLIFLGVWLTAVVYAGKAERLEASRSAEAAARRAPTADDALLAEAPPPADGAAPADGAPAAGG